MNIGKLYGDLKLGKILVHRVNNRPLWIGVDGYPFQQRWQVIALMGIGGGDVQFLDIAFLIGTGMLFVTEFV